MSSKPVGGLRFEVIMQTYVEHLFLSPCEDKDKKTQTKVEIFTTNKNNSVSDDCNDGSDYKEIMEKIIYDSKNL